MFEQKKVYVRICKKYNTGNYESQEIDVFMATELNPEQDFNEAYSELLQRCIAARHEAETELGLRQEPSVTTQAYFAGKPLEEDDYSDF